MRRYYLATQNILMQCCIDFSFVSRPYPDESITTIKKTVYHHSLYMKNMYNSSSTIVFINL